MKIGIICALSEEVIGLTKKFDNKKETTIARLTYYSGNIGNIEIIATECGIGKVNAAMSTQILIDFFKPNMIINSGIAGSLSKDIKIGDIVISSECLQHDYNVTALGDPLGRLQFNDETRTYFPADENIVNNLLKACESLENTQIFTGRIASGDIFISSIDKRQQIANTFNALACEMEGASVGHVAYRNNIPFAILRCISDDFNQNESIDYLKFKEISANKSIKTIFQFINLYN